MKLINSSDMQARLEEVRLQFEHWRCNRDKRGAIPESLWAAAASLYPEHSLHRISKTLRLNYTKLKHYVRGSSADFPIAAAQHFIQIEGSPLSRQCIIEMRHSNGNRMTVQGVDNQHLMKLVQLFWSRP
ncbi:MAG: hypothetical protein SRB2_03867 [Desulfobacteraceae bacterium Eth-SRB2]|nr:MAG: hypothetical protein SRB2_03867 [Desulfobacteraceae bacterium Eth-SRB2]